jgi:hypothetical protein
MSSELSEGREALWTAGLETGGYKSRRPVGDGV